MNDKDGRKAVLVASMTLYRMRADPSSPVRTKPTPRDTSSFHATLLLHLDYTSTGVGHCSDCLHTALAQDNFAIAVDNDDNQEALTSTARALFPRENWVFVPAPDVE